MNSITHGGRVKRNIAPRTAPEANSVYEPIPKHSRPISDGSHVTAEFWNTPAGRMLKDGGKHSGLFLFDWLKELTSDPESRRFAALMAWLFDSRESNSGAVRRNRLREQTHEEAQRQTPEQYKVYRRRDRCRAQAFRDVSLTNDEGEEQSVKVRCYVRTLPQMALACGYSPRVLRRVLGGMNSAFDPYDNRINAILRFPDCQSGIAIAPNGICFAQAYMRHLNSMDLMLQGGAADETEVPKTIKMMCEWFESPFRRMACNRDGRTKFDINDFDEAAVARGYFRMKSYKKHVERGTWVDDLTHGACEGRSGPSHLLSFLIWQHGRCMFQQDGETISVPRSPLVINGCRWYFHSDRQFAKDLGYDRHVIMRWRDWLITKGFIRTEGWKFAGWNTADNGITHYTLCADKLYKAMCAGKTQASLWKAARTPPKASNKPVYFAIGDTDQEDAELKAEIAALRAHQIAIGNM